MSRDDRADQLAPRTAIRRPTTATPAARAADVFQTVEPPAAPAPEPAPGLVDPAPADRPRRGRPRKAAAPMHRTTVVYPDHVLLAMKLEALRDKTSAGEIVRAALAAESKAPARLAEAAEPWVNAPGVRTTIDIDDALHRRLRVLAAERRVTVQSLILAALSQARPDLFDQD